MASINRLKPGQVVYSVERRKAGNTTVTQDYVFTVKIISVDLENGFVSASWNGNSPQKFYSHSIKKWRISEPDKSKLKRPFG